MHGPSLEHNRCLWENHAKHSRANMIAQVAITGSRHKYITCTRAHTHTHTRLSLYAFHTCLSHTLASHTNSSMTKHSSHLHVCLIIHPPFSHSYLSFASLTQLDLRFFLLSCQHHTETSLAFTHLPSHPHASHIRSSLSLSLMKKMHAMHTDSLFSPTLSVCASTATSVSVHMMAD